MTAATFTTECGRREKSAAQIMVDLFVWYAKKMPYGTNSRYNVAS